MAPTGVEKLAIEPMQSPSGQVLVSANRRLRLMKSPVLLHALPTAILRSKT